LKSLNSFLSELGPDPTSPKARKFLANELPFADYFAIARAYEANHVFWDGLIADACGKKGVALVLETRLGSVSAAMARCFDHVISWHRTTDAADVSKLWLEKCALPNISVFVGEHFGENDFPEISLASIVLVGPDTDPTGQWGEDGEIPLRSLLDSARLRLCSDGQIIIVDNNKCAYKKPDLKRRRRGLALPKLKDRLEGQRFQTEIYVCGAPLTPSHVPPPDLFLRSSRSIGSNLPKNWLSSLKNELLNQPSVRLLWPSFLVIATCRPRPTFFDGLLGMEKLAVILNWQRSEKIEVKRIVAGNSGTSIAIAGPATRNTADIVIRLPSTERGKQLCQVNARALIDMMHSPLAALVPRLIDEGVFAGRSYFIETRCPGFEVYGGTRGLAKMVQTACLTMSRMQLQGAAQTIITPDDFDTRIAPFIDDIAHFCTPSVMDRLLVLKGRLRNRMSGKPVSLGVIHGDFKLGNILFDNSGNLTALIDWDGYSRSGFQLFDYFTLLTYKIAYDSDRSMAKIYVEYLLPWKLPTNYAQLVDAATKDLTVDSESFLCLRIVFWFALLNARFEALYKYHRRWHEEYLNPVLGEMERAISC